MKAILIVGFCLCLIVAIYCFLTFAQLVMSYDFVNAQRYLFTCGFFTLFAGIADEWLSGCYN